MVKQTRSRASHKLKLHHQQKEKVASDEQLDTGNHHSDDDRFSKAAATRTMNLPVGANKSNLMINRLINRLSCLVSQNM